MENKVLPGALRLFYNGWLNEKHSMQLIRCAHRAECDMNPIVYCKAVRATLLALGFNSDWVEVTFRKMLEEEYIYK